MLVTSYRLTFPYWSDAMSMRGMRGLRISLDLVMASKYWDNRSGPPVFIAFSRTFEAY